MSILAAIIAGALAFMVCALWYTVLFGKLWQREVGITDEQIKAAGSLSSVFIVTKDGKYIDSDITIEEMLESGKQGISNGKGNPVAKFMSKAFYPMQLNKLERWK